MSNMNQVEATKRLGDHADGFDAPGDWSDNRDEIIGLGNRLGIDIASGQITLPRGGALRPLDLEAIKNNLPAHRTYADADAGAYAQQAMTTEEANKSRIKKGLKKRAEANTRRESKAAKRKGQVVTYDLLDLRAMVQDGVPAQTAPTPNLYQSDMFVSPAKSRRTGIAKRGVPAADLDRATANLHEAWAARTAAEVAKNSKEDELEEKKREEDRVVARSKVKDELAKTSAGMVQTSQQFVVEANEKVQSAEDRLTRAQDQFRAVKEEVERAKRDEDAHGRWKVLAWKAAKRHNKELHLKMLVLMDLTYNASRLMESTAGTTSALGEEPEAEETKVAPEAGTGAGTTPEAPGSAHAEGGEEDDDEESLGSLDDDDEGLGGVEAQPEGRRVAQQVGDGEANYQAQLRDLERRVMSGEFNQLSTGLTFSAGRDSESFAEWVADQTRSVGATAETGAGQERDGNTTALPAAIEALFGRGGDDARDGEDEDGGAARPAPATGVVDVGGHQIDVKEFIRSLKRDAQEKVAKIAAETRLPATFAQRDDNGSACPWDQQPAKDADPMDHARRGSSSEDEDEADKYEPVLQPPYNKVARREEALRQALTEQANASAALEGDVRRAEEATAATATVAKRLAEVRSEKKKLEGELAAAGARYVKAIEAVKACAQAREAALTRLQNQVDNIVFTSSVSPIPNPKTAPNYGSATPAKPKFLTAKEASAMSGTNIQNMVKNGVVKGVWERTDPNVCWAAYSMALRIMAENVICYFGTQYKSFFQEATFEDGLHVVRLADEMYIQPNPGTAKKIRLEYEACKMDRGFETFRSYWARLEEFKTKYNRWRVPDEDGNFRDIHTAAQKREKLIEKDALHPRFKGVINEIKSEERKQQSEVTNAEIVDRLKYLEDTCSTDANAAENYPAFVAPKKGMVRAKAPLSGASANTAEVVAEPFDTLWEAMRVKDRTEAQHALLVSGTAYGASTPRGAGRRTTESKTGGGGGRDGAGAEQCRYFEQGVTCRFGDRCRFAHGDYVPAIRNGISRDRRTPGPCFNWQKNGSCERGNNCRFNHNIPVTGVGRPERRSRAPRREGDSESKRSSGGGGPATAKMKLGDPANPGNWVREQCKKFKICSNCGRSGTECVNDRWKCDAPDRTIIDWKKNCTLKCAQLVTAARTASAAGADSRPPQPEQGARMLNAGGEEAAMTAQAQVRQQARTTSLAPTTSGTGEDSSRTLSPPARVCAGAGTVTPPKECQHVPLQARTSKRVTQQFINTSSMPNQVALATTSTTLATTPGAPRDGWSFDYKNINLNEALGHPNTLYVVRVTAPNNDFSEYTDPKSSEWRLDNRVGLCCCSNVAIVRVPTSAAGRPLLPADYTERDVATALALARHGHFTHVTLDERFEEHHSSACLLRGLTSSRTKSGGASESKADVSRERELIELHRRRLRIKDVSTKVISIFSGIGSDVGVVKACCDGEQVDVLCSDICPENTATIRERFPEALVLTKDALDNDTLERLKESLHVGPADRLVVLVYVLCQPSSDANRHRSSVINTKRISVGEKGVKLACDLTRERDQSVIVVEDVSGLERNQAESYSRITSMLNKAHQDYYHEFTLNAQQVLVSMNSLRWFAVAATGLARDDLVNFQRALDRQRRLPTSATCPSMAQVFAEYHKREPELKKFKGMFMPTLSRQDTRVRLLSKRARRNTLVYDRSGLNKENWRKYATKHHSELPVHPSQVLVPEPRHLGILAGAPYDMPWSVTRRCDCPACGKRGTVGGIQRANMLVPQQLFFILTHVLAVSDKKEKVVRFDHAATAGGSSEVKPLQQLQRVDEDDERNERDLEAKCPECPRAHANAVTDEEAADYLRLMHQRLNHCTMPHLRQLHRSGAIFGPAISDEQFECLQFNCATCARNAKRRRSKRRNKGTQPRKLSLLEEVAVDVVLVHRNTPSARVRGEKGNLKSGGNNYAVVYLDRSTEHNFVDFIRTKDQLEDSVNKMQAWMETEAKKSKEYNGTPITVRRWVSDQDANLTSRKAIVQFLEERTGHLIAAPDAKNGTPLLDNLIYRLNNGTAKLLDAAGLPFDCWEMAMRHVSDLLNHSPTSRHPQRHTPKRRWDGKREDLTTFLTFGADVFLYRDQKDRPNKAKIDPTAPGGEGRYRWVGRGRSVGSEAMDDSGQILDTADGVLMMRRNFTVNEDLREVSEMDTPEDSYDKTWVEKWSDKQMVRDTPAKDLEEGADLDPKRYEQQEEPLEGEAKEEPVKKDRPANAPVFEHKTRDSAPLPEPPERTKDTKPKHSKAWGSRSDRFHLDAKLDIRQDNPKRKGTASWDRYQRYKKATTVREFFSLGGTRGDLRNDTAPKYGYVRALSVCSRPPRRTKQAPDWCTSSARTSGNDSATQADPRAAAARAAHRAKLASEAALSAVHSMSSCLASVNDDAAAIAAASEEERRAARTVGEWLRSLGEDLERDALCEEVLIDAGVEEEGDLDDIDAGIMAEIHHALTAVTSARRVKRILGAIEDRRLARTATRSEGRRALKRSLERKYSAYCASLRAYRAELGVEDVIPTGVTGQDYMSPFWEATATHAGTDHDLDKGIGMIGHLAEHFAEWHVKGDEKNKSVVRGLASQAFDIMSTSYFAHLIEELSHLRASEIPTPKTYRDAMVGDFAKYWVEAIEQELDNLKNFKVFKWVDREPGQHLIDSRWVFKAKTNDKGQCERFKARLVAKGYKQIYGVDYCDSSSPVGKLDTLRVLVAEAAQVGNDVAFLDIKSAYLTADLQVKQFMEVPKGVTPPKPDQVLQIDKGLYGLVQGARVFHHDFRRKLLSWGFCASAADPCCFVKHTGGQVMRLLLFVDDMAIFTQRSKAGAKMKQDLIDQVEKEYKYSCSDDDDVYLGMAVRRVGQNAYFLTQGRYVDDLSLRFGTAGCRPTFTTTNSEKISTKDCYDGEPSKNPHGRRFREICGALRWLEQCTRPDISAALSELCKVQANPGEKHVAASEHLMRYVTTTKDHGILYGGPMTDKSDGPCIGYVDSDWGGDPDTYHSRGGYVFTSWQSPVSWSSYKMKSVAASSCESEYMSAAHATRQAIWLRYLFSDLGYGDLSPTAFGKLCAKDYEKKSLGDVVPGEAPLMVLIDNKGALAVTENSVNHKRSKHIHIAYHISKQHVAKRHIRFNYISTHENLADLMTKAVTKSVHDHLVRHLLHSWKDGKVHLHHGEPVDPDAFRPLGQHELYKTQPRGLLKDDLLTPALLKEVDQAHVTGDIEHICQVIDKLSSGEASVSSDQTASWLSAAADAQQLSRAIIDSGASFTYVTKDVVLRDAVQSDSAVWVANGQRERVAEEGSLGPLARVKKVNSFSRTLVSVADLVEQYGGLYFDKLGAHVVSEDASGDTIVTTIGTLTKSRLYSFDLASLSRHASKCSVSG